MILSAKRSWIRISESLLKLFSNGPVFLLLCVFFLFDLFYFNTISIHTFGHSPKKRNVRRQKNKIGSKKFFLDINPYDFDQKKN